MKLLTVTVPCYNSEDYMRNCIDSLLPGGDRVEVIIIDDGSKDNTGAIADEYAEKYPDIVKVIHQENGGHGEGINQGIKHATGTYFKVVDSDDRMSEDFLLFLDKLEECEKNGGVDLFVTNYYYTHNDGVGDRSINYSNALPENRIFGWKDIKRFRIEQLITIHSGTYRTEKMRMWGCELPKHTFYEDNLMVYLTLQNVEKIYYLNKDLYLYTIGREGQSVQHDITMRRYSHQVLVSKLCFTAFHLDDIKEKKLRQYLAHDLFMLLAIAITFARLNKSKETDDAVTQMWNECRAFDKKWANHFYYKNCLVFMSIPGKFGRWFSCTLHKLANKVVRFN